MVLFTDFYKNLHSERKCDQIEVKYCWIDNHIDYSSRYWVVELQIQPPRSYYKIPDV